ncbi:MAG: formylglycine-generating enzyme family protein [Opitutales bacterium]
MPFEEETRGFFGRFKQPFRVVLVVLLIGGTLGAVYYLSERLQPAPISEASIVLNDEEIPDDALLAEVAQLESEFLSAWDLGNITEADRGKIERAVALQERFNARRGFDQDAVKRLSELRKLEHNAQAFPKNRRIERLLGDVRMIESEDGDKEELTRKLKDALELQNDINDHHGLSVYQDLEKEANLRARIVNIEVAPLRREAAALEQAAALARTEERYTDAISNLTKAVDVHRAIMSKAGTATTSNHSRVIALQAQLESLKSAGLHEKVNALVAEAKDLEEKRRSLEAAELYLEAYETQVELNNNFPRSDFESRDRANELLNQMQMARSRELAEEILSDSKRLDEHLLRGEMSRASRLVSELADKADRFSSDFPDSGVITEEQILKLKVLKLLRGNFGFLQQHIVSNLRPVPDFEGVYIFDHEVTQALYNAVMQNNPSQEPRGDDFPVHALSWTEAERFCQRLGWILARPVRLPKRDEFRSALGSLRYLSADPRDADTSLNLDAISWNLSNSRGRIQKVETSQPNPAGFHDLLGNVAEWIQPSEEAIGNQVLVIGGSAVDTTDSLLQLPEETRGRGERTRFIGFRFAVEWDQGTESTASLDP